MASVSAKRSRPRPHTPSPNQQAYAHANDHAAFLRNLEAIQSKIQEANAGPGLGQAISAPPEQAPGQLLQNLAYEIHNQYWNQHLQRLAQNVAQAQATGGNRPPPRPGEQSGPGHGRPPAVQQGGGGGPSHGRPPAGAHPLAPVQVNFHTPPGNHYGWFNAHNPHSHGAFPAHEIRHIQKQRGLLGGLINRGQ